MKTLIVSPMQQEVNFLVQHCTTQGFQTENSIMGRLPIVWFPELGLTLARGGTGKAQFAIHTQHLLDACPDWALVICAGAAGALVDDLSIGDVVIATTTVEHDYNNRFSNRPKPTFEGAHTAMANLKRQSPSFNAFKVHFGTVASGDEDIVDLKRREILHQVTGALAVAWEGAGGARACKFSQTPFLEIRGVTDVADDSAPTDFAKNLEVAMRHIATLIISWVSAHGP